MIEQFRKDFMFYLLGILIPGVINFLAIPVFKNLLGDAAYGQFSLLFTALLILNTALVGWIGQSVIRIGMQSPDKHSFMGHSLWVSMLILLCACIPIVVVLVFLQTSLILILLFVGVLIATSQQVTLVSISQSFFRARLTFLTEAVRVILFFFIGFALLRFTGNSNGVQKLFLALLVSNITSTLMLLYGNALVSTVLRLPNFALLKKTLRQLFQYGIYLMLWFLLNYALLFADRYLIAWFYGNDVAGNYSAMFDLINRSIGLLGTPVLAAIFPIITRGYEMGDLVGVKKMLNKTIRLEVFAIFLGLLCYFIFGFDILNRLLSLPSSTNQYLFSGALILVGSVIGQIGMLLHKRLELAKRTSIMLICMVIAFALSLVSNLLLLKPYGILGTSFSYLLGTSSYALSVWLISSDVNLKQPAEQKDVEILAGKL